MEKDPSHAGRQYSNDHSDLGKGDTGHRVASGAPSLQDSRLAHFVCYRILEPESSPSWWLAGPAARLTRESIWDEVPHLPAAVQFCGFRSDDVGNGRCGRAGHGQKLLQLSVLGQEAKAPCYES
jgi:hypothetical protein